MYEPPSQMKRPTPRRISDVAPTTAPQPDAPVPPVTPVPPVSHEGSDAEVTPVTPVSSGEVLAAVREWFARYICPLSELDLDLLTLWTGHTHFAEAMYTTPRLVIDSPLPESGKTTTLEHLERLCFAPMQIASLSSPAMLTRLLDAGMRTLLLDEAEKNLRPGRDGVEDLLAVLNTGYKRGGSRPVLVPNAKGGWDAKAMPTFSPLAMAGISPQLPDDTLSRTVSVMLLPDDTGLIEDSDWEFIEPDAIELASRLGKWAADVADVVKANNQPELPDGCKGRSKEKWRPLKRVADAAGGRWPDACTQLIERDLQNRANDHEEGLMTQRPSIALVRDMITAWPRNAPHWPTDDICRVLTGLFPDRWGPSERYPKGLTSQRIGLYLGKQWHVHTVRLSRNGDEVRGYLHRDLYRLATRAGVVAAPRQGTGVTGGSGETADSERHDANGG